MLTTDLIDHAKMIGNEAVLDDLPAGWTVRFVLGHKSGATYLATHAAGGVSVLGMAGTLCARVWAANELAQDIEPIDPFKVADRFTVVVVERQGDVQRFFAFRPGDAASSFTPERMWREGSGWTWRPKDALMEGLYTEPEPLPSPPAYPPMTVDDREPLPMDPTTRYTAVDDLDHPPALYTVPPVHTDADAPPTVKPTDDTEDEVLF